MTPQQLLEKREREFIEYLHQMYGMGLIVSDDESNRKEADKEANIIQKNALEFFHKTIIELLEEEVKRLEGEKLPNRTFGKMTLTNAEKAGHNQAIQSVIDYYKQKIKELDI